MRKIIITYGVVAGAVIIGSMILTNSLVGQEDSVNLSEWLGYLVMIVALSVIFVGIKRYRDRELGGVIKFGTAAMLGLGISLVASVVYVVVWEVNLAMTDYTFIDEYTQSVIEKNVAEGVSGADMRAVVAEMEEMKEQYAKPVYRLAITFLEIFPVALLITLLSAAVLRNSKVLPATT